MADESVGQIDFSKMDDEAIRNFATKLHVGFDEVFVKRVQDLADNVAGHYTPELFKEEQRAEVAQVLYLFGLLITDKYTRRETVRLLERLKSEIVSDKERAMEIDVKSCQRCGKDHDKMAFYPLSNPVDDFRFYGHCGETSEPVLLRVREKTSH